MLRPSGGRPAPALAPTPALVAGREGALCSLGFASGCLSGCPVCTACTTRAFSLSACFLNASSLASVRIAVPTSGAQLVVSRSEKAGRGMPGFRTGSRSVGLWVVRAAWATLERSRAGSGWFGLFETVVRS